MTGHRKSVGLLPFALKPLPLGSVRARGWLARQLQLQAGALASYLDESYPGVADSRWFGGSTHSYESAPYWLDGAVALAHTLDDADMKARVNRRVEHVLTQQREDGWLGPVETIPRPWDYRYPPDEPLHDPWPAMVMLKALTQYHEATGDERVPRVLEQFFGFMGRFVDALAPLPPAKPKQATDWSSFVFRARWQELLLSIHWLTDLTGDTRWLPLALRVRETGFDWLKHFRDFDYAAEVRENMNPTSHVVNNAMALKAAALCYRQSHSPEDRSLIARGVEVLDRYHGQATGMFSGNEHLAGKMPSQGTELCAIVECMFSLETLLSVCEDPALADRLERIAFNALPAAISPDMWSHQYHHQANQVVCKISDPSIFAGASPDANLFGFELCCPCCLTNMQQGWPKFAAHLWRRSRDGGLAAVAYAPCRVDTTVHGAQVGVRVDTDYPFEEQIHITVSTRRAVRFNLQLRIPGWATEPRVVVDGRTLSGVEPGSFFPVDRTWDGTTEIDLHLAAAFRFERRYHDSAALYRGPLVYSLRIGEDWRVLRGEAPVTENEVYPTTPWNYALRVDGSDPETCLKAETRPADRRPFSPDGAPVVVKMRGRRLPEWQEERNAAAPPPDSPVSSSEPEETIELIPYGAANLRVTEFPVLARDA